MALWSAAQCRDCLRRDGSTCVLPACLTCHYRSVGCIPSLCLQGHLLLCMVYYFPEPTDDSGPRYKGNKGIDIKGNNLLAARHAWHCGRCLVRCPSNENVLKTSKEIVTYKHSALMDRCCCLGIFLYFIKRDCEK